MDAEMKRIWEMIGALSDAQWRRASQPGVSALHVLFEEPYRPESAEECAIWDELTAPHQYPALRRFVESRREPGTNKSPSKFDEALLVEATSRWEQWTASRMRL